MPVNYGVPQFGGVAATIYGNRSSGQAYIVGTGTFFVQLCSPPTIPCTDSIVDFTGGSTFTADVACYVGAIQPWNPTTRQGFIGGTYGDGTSRAFALDFSLLPDGVTTLIVLGRYGTYYGFAGIYIGGQVAGGSATIVPYDTAPSPPAGALRLAACGFEIQQAGPGPESKAVQKGLTPGRIVGHAFTIAGFVDGVTPGSTQWAIDPSDGVTRRAHHERFYLRVREYPTALEGGLRIHGISGSIEGTDDAFITVLAADGTLQWFNKGNGARTFACQITTPLELNVWYRVSLFYNFNNSGNAFAADDTAVFVAMVRKSNDPYRLIINGDPSTNIFDVMFNDTDSPTITGATGTLFNVNLTTSNVLLRLAYSQPNWAGYKGAHVSSNGLSYSSSQKWDRTTFGIGNFAQVDTDGGIVDVDDFVADAGISPGPGWIVPWHPVAAGTYAEWSGNQDWRAVAQLPTTSGTTSPLAVVNNVGATPGKKISFLMAPPPGTFGTIRSVQIGLYGGIARTNWKFLFVKNGADTTVAQVATSTSNSWLSSTVSLSGVGVLIDAAANGGIAGSDILEVGVIDGTQANVNTSWLSQVLLLVEHEAVDPPVPIQGGGAIRVELGTYTGNGTYQIIPTLSEPDLLFLRPDGANGGVWWTKAHGPNGNHAVRLDSSDQFSGSVVQVSGNGFIVTQNGFSNVNPSATTVRWMAISDPSRRMIALGGYMPNSAGVATVADPTIYLDDTSFAIEGLFVFAGFNSGTGKHSYRSVLQATFSPTNLSSYLDSATADRILAIQAFGATATDQFPDPAGTFLADPPWTALASSAGDMRLQVDGAQRAYPNSAVRDCLERRSTAPSADQFSQAISAFTGPGDGSGYIYLILRASGDYDTGSWYWFWSDGGSDTKIAKVTGGGGLTPTTLSSANTTTVAIGDIFRFEVAGTSLKVYKNGSVITALTVTDSAISTGAPGIGAYGTGLVKQWSGSQGSQTGRFVVGSILDSVNFDQGWYTAFRTSGVFNQTVLCQIGSYVGDGTSSQNVVFPTPLAAAGLIIVIPTTARQRLYRFASDSTSRNLTSGASVTGGITAFSTLGFTVGNTNGHNTNTEAFNYIAFAGQDGGSTEPPVPPIDETMDTLDAGVGLTLAANLIMEADTGPALAVEARLIVSGAKFPNTDIYVPTGADENQWLLLRADVAPRTEQSS